MNLNNNYTPLEPAFIPPATMEIETTRLSIETTRLSDSETTRLSDSETTRLSDSETTRLSDSETRFINLVKNTPVEYIDDNIVSIRQLITSVRIGINTLSSCVCSLMDIISNCVLTSKIIQDYLRFFITKNIKIQHWIIYYKNKVSNDVDKQPIIECNEYFSKLFKKRNNEIYSNIYKSVLNDYCNHLETKHK